MNTAHEQAEFVGNGIASEDRASRESCDHVDGAERRDVPLRSERAEEVIMVEIGSPASTTLQ